MDEVGIDAAAIRPRVTRGINPGQSIFVDERLSAPADLPPGRRGDCDRAGMRGLPAPPED